MNNTFEIVSGKVIVSDPCYEKLTWCSGELKNVKNGKWLTKIEERQGVIGVFIVHHENNHPGKNWDEQRFEVGVDSGQAGVFDEKFYKDDSVVQNLSRYYDRIIRKDEPWYSFCCDRTLAEDRFGVIPYGAISSSGCGDGVYTCYTQKDSKGKIVAIKIEFVKEDKDEDLFECDRCGEYFDIDDSILKDGEMVCEGCLKHKE